MSFPEHAEVLAADWMPPTLLGRERALEAARNRLEPADPSGPTPLVVIGPAGSGTSAVALRAARAYSDRRRRADGIRPRVVAVRVRWCAGSTGVAAELLRHFDDGFHERGFSTSEILAGFLRRALREPLPLVVVLHDVSAGAPDLGPIVRALCRPRQFLPEGVDAAPVERLLLAGTSTGPGLSGPLGELSGSGSGAVVLDPYSAEDLSAILTDRATRALGTPPSAGLVERIVRHAQLEGRGAARAIELLREELLGEAAPSFGALSTSRASHPVLTVERAMLDALAQACARGPVEVASLRALADRLAVAQGARSMPVTTFWRRLVRLEQAGLISREVRSGGPGGSRSKVRLLRPVRSWGPIRDPQGIRRGFGATSTRVGPNSPGWSWERPGPASPQVPWPAPGAGGGVERGPGRRSPVT